MKIYFAFLLGLCGLIYSTQTYAGNISSDRYFYFNNNLQYGTKDSSEVRMLQTYLIQNKFLKGTPNGSFYGPTQAAVKKFQKSVGLAGTGYVGPKTRDILNKEFGNVENQVRLVNGICGLDIKPDFYSEIEFPLTINIEKVQNNPYCNWTEFEGVLGTAKLYYGTYVEGKGETVPKYSGEEVPVVKGNIVFTGEKIKNKKGYVHIVFTEDNPSGFKNPKKFTLKLDNYK